MSAPIDLSRPRRRSPAWDRVYDRLADEVRVAFAQPEFRAEWLDYLRGFVATWNRSRGSGGLPPEELERKLRAHEERMLPVLARNLPHFAEAAGEYLLDWLRRFTIRGLKREYRGSILPLAKPLSGNLLAMTSRERRRYALEWAALVDGCQEPGRPGRRKKPAGTPPRRTSRGIDPELAERTLRMREDGKKPLQIARVLFPNTDWSDPRARDRARNAVNRAIECGRLNRNKKTAPTPQKSGR